MRAAAGSAREEEAASGIAEEAAEDCAEASPAPSDGENVAEEEPAVRSCLGALKGPFLAPDLSRVAGDGLRTTRLIGIYFSASWCPPCRQFTPVLAAAHRQIQGRFGSKAWEVVLVPRDTQEADWRDYFSGMPWVSLPFGHSDVVRLLDFFEVEKIPRLCVVDHRGITVCDDARGGMGFGFGLSPIAAYEWLASRIGFSAEELLSGAAPTAAAKALAPPPGDRTASAGADDAGEPAKNAKPAKPSA